jgi:hypothetical protein
MIRHYFSIALLFGLAGSASAQARAVVSADEARFSIPIGRNVTEEWTWYRAATATNSAEYIWRVRIGRRYSAGFALFKFPGASPKEGSFADLLRAGQADVASLTPTAGTVVMGYRPALSGESDSLIVEIDGKDLIDTLFRGRPRTVVFETYSPYSARRLITVPVIYTIVPSANRPPITH